MEWFQGGSYGCQCTDYLFPEREVRGYSGKGYAQWEWSAYSGRDWYVSFLQMGGCREVLSKFVELSFLKLTI